MKRNKDTDNRAAIGRMVGSSDLGEKKLSLGTTFVVSRNNFLKTIDK